MAVLRTKRLGVGKSTGSGTKLIYTVPSGHRGIVRDVRVYNGSASSSLGVTLFLTDSGGSGDYNIHVVTLNTGATSALVCDLVLEQGDSFNLFTAVAGVSVWVSGAELPLP